MNEIAANESIDMFFTMGDNLYPLNATNPTKDEIAQMMDLFEDREHLADLPIYAIRGNHDCYFDKEVLLDLSKEDN